MATKIKMINIEGTDVKDVTLNESIWAIEPNNTVLKKSLDLYRASLHQGTKATKGVGEVSGSGKKPWRQKGTGNARVGQKRNPIWRGGGHAFALSPRDFTFKMNKKEKTLALKSALSQKVLDKELKIVDNIDLPTLKTKDFKNVASKLKLSTKVLFITKEDNENLYMATRNLSNMGCMLANELNTFDIVHADTIVLDEAAFNHIEEVLK